MIVDVQQEPRVWDVATPEWVTDAMALDARMLTLVYGVAQQTGQSRRRSADLCHRVLTTAMGHGDPGSGGRRVRARVLAALRAELGMRVEAARLENALREVVLVDEMVLLPRRQRFAMWASARASASVADIATRTGWTPTQVARLLRSALTTLTANSGLGR